MPFTEHLRELRNRLLICDRDRRRHRRAAVLAVAVRHQMDDARVFPRASQLHAFGPADVIFTEFKFSLVGGIVLGLPVLLHQLWMFVVPAIHPRTRRMVYAFVVPSLLLALRGLRVRAFRRHPARRSRRCLHITDAVATPTFGIASTLNFVIVLLALFAIIFQTPIVLIGLARLGIVNARAADALPPPRDLRLFRRRRHRRARRQPADDGAARAADVRAVRSLDLGDRRCSNAVAPRRMTRVERPARAALYGDFIRTFGNVLFAVSLFVVWGVLTLIGVIVDQGKDPSIYFATYAAPLARAILRLDFDNIYHSPWYVGIVGLILLSLAVCTFKRVIPARLPPLRPVKIDKIPLHATFEAAGDADDVRGRVAAVLRARAAGGCASATSAASSGRFADKHNWARRGVLVAHVGFVIIAAGTTLYWARGFSGETARAHRPDGRRFRRRTRCCGSTISLTRSRRS